MSQAMTAVVAGGPGLVAVGVDDSIGDWRAAAWVSVDGAAWSRVLHQEVAFGGPDAQITSSLVVGGPGLVAVGSEWLGGGWDAAAWTSIDGRAWSHVQHQEAEFGGADWQTMEAVAPGPSALVAVGSDHSGGDDDAAVWASPPGP